MRKPTLKSKQYGIQQSKKQLEQLKNWYLLWDGLVIVSETQIKVNLILMRMLPIHHKILVLVLSMKDLKKYFGKYRFQIQKIFASKPKFMIQYFVKSELVRKFLLKKLERHAF